MGGWKRNPAWYYNLVANRDAWIEVGNENIAVTAVASEGQARERLFAQHAAAYPQFTYYQGKTSRKIPVIVLRPKP